MDDNVYSLGRAPLEQQPETRATPLGRLHSIATAGMALFAIVGALSILAFITVSWPADSGRYLWIVFVSCIVGFIACASAAVLAAAKDTYPTDRPSAKADD